jgi:hypothetical protein
MELPPILPPSVPPTPTGKLKRHGCLTACLIFILLVEGCGILVGSFHSAPGAAAPASPLAGMAILSPPPAWYSLCIQLLSAADIVCVIFIFLRKKWAFFGCVGVAGSVLVLSIFAGRTFDGISAFALPAILYGVLQIGGENSGWKQLK